MANPQLENGYIKIANELAEALSKIRISGEAMQMFWAIMRKTYGFNKKKDHISTSQFIECTGLSRGAVAKARQKLLKMNIITISKKAYSQVLIYRINKNYESWKPSPKRGIPKKGYGTVSQKVHNCIPKGGTSVYQKVAHKRHKDNNKDKTKDNIPYKEIIDYLNQKLNKNYRSSTQKNKDLIRARWKEGNRIEDFKKVIDNMYEKWINDPKNCQYLRPETLFGNKFESYLNLVACKGNQSNNNKPLIGNYINGRLTEIENE